MKKKILSLFMTLVMVVGLVGVMPVVSAGAAAKNVINCNVSSSAVTKNATDGKLPSAATVYAGNSYYYNIQVSNDLKVKTFKLYVKDVGQSKYTCAFTDTASNYMRYTSKKYTFKKTGNVSYYWQIKYTNGKTTTTSVKSIAVKNATVINTNVASSRVGTNATDGKLPSAATLYAGNSYYFNIQVSNNLKVKKFQIYVKDVGKNSYSRISTQTADNYMRYASKKYTFAKAGNISYYWVITYTNGKTQQTSAKTLKVNKQVSSNSNGSSTLPTGIYLKQNGSTTCTLASAAMMLRARKYLSGKSYSSITESAIRSTAWVNGQGLRFSFKYSGISVSHKKSSGISASTLKNLLDKHPEGIVLYCGKIPHAVFLTDYSGDTFYCADPVSSYSGRRIKLASSSLGKKYSTQANILSNVTAYWYVSSY